MARPFKELRDQMTPERRLRNEAAAKAEIAEMLLAELRRQAELTQTELAIELGVKQPTLSQLESQDDMQISTLRRIVTALGGQLDIIARLPSGDVRLSQFLPQPRS